MSGAWGNVKGYLFKDPEMKRSKAGSDYATATLKVRDGDENKFWRIMAFKDATSILMDFKEGDALKAEGGIKVETYEKDGQTRVSLSVMANAIEAWTPQSNGGGQKPAQSNRRPAEPYRRPAAAVAANGGPSHMPAMRHHGGHSPDPALDDDIPF